MERLPGYQRRIIDEELDELLPELPAILIEGPKAVGKTSTALDRARSMLRLDHPGDQDLVEADPTMAFDRPAPLLIDEWQLKPAVWDAVRRAVDARPTSGRFILTGSAVPATRPTHSGAGRITTIRMRPLALCERWDAPEFTRPTVSLSAMLDGDAQVSGATDVDVAQYASEICRSGIPPIRAHRLGRAHRAALDGYLDRIVDTDFPEAGLVAKRPVALRGWLVAYAAASSTTARWETIRDAAAPGTGAPLSRPTAESYREALDRIRILDGVEGWLPGRNHMSRLTMGPRHFLADPALAVRLLNLTESELVRDGALLGRMFESLIALNLKVFTQHCEANLAHLRTSKGVREVDFIVTGSGGRTVAIEVKLSGSVDDHDVRHLNWLKDRLGDQLVDRVVITTGDTAYRRADGVAVIPAALLGP